MSSFNEKHPYSKSFEEPNQPQKLKYTLAMTPEDHHLLQDEISGITDQLEGTFSIPASEAIGYRGFINNKGDQLSFAMQKINRKLAQCSLTLTDNQAVIQHNLKLDRHPSRRYAWRYDKKSYLDDSSFNNHYVSSNDVVGIVSSYIDESTNLMNSMLDSHNNSDDITELMLNMAEEYDFSKTFQEKSWKYRRLLDPDDPLSSYDVQLSDYRSATGDQLELAISAPLNLSLNENPGFFESIRQAYLVRYNTSKSGLLTGEAQHIISPNTPITDQTIVEAMKNAFYDKEQANNNSDSGENNRLIFSKGLEAIVKNQRSELDNL